MNFLEGLQSMQVVLTFIETFMLVEQYFCKEINFSKKDWMRIGILAIGLGIVGVILPNDTPVGVVLLGFWGIVVLVILLKSGRKRWTKIFYIIPATWLGSVVMALVYLMIGMASPIGTEIMVREETGELLVSLLLFCMLRLIYVAYYWHWKKAKKPKFIFGAWGIFILWILINVNSLGLVIQNEVKTFFNGETQPMIMLGVSVLPLIVDVFAVAYLTKLKYANHYKELVTVNKQYMALQLKYFDEYKKNQEETRRFKHDMNNHLLCMKNLYAQDKKEEFLKYMEQMTEGAEELCLQFVTGNDVANAILNEKYATMTAHNIQFECEGRFPDPYKIEAIDVCIILANLLDNAIEECTKIKDRNSRRIILEIMNSKNHTILRMSNSISRKVKVCLNHIVTTKGDQANHGWGIENIRRVIGNYNGEMSLKCDETTFVVEIII